MTPAMASNAALIAIDVLIVLEIFHFGIAPAWHWLCGIVGRAIDGPARRSQPKAIPSSPKTPQAYQVADDLGRPLVDVVAAAELRAYEEDAEAGDHYDL